MKKQEQNPQSLQAQRTPLQRSLPKIAILHDAFLYRGGGERLVTLMAKSLSADIITGFFSEWSFDPRELGFTGKMIALGSPVFAKGIRHMILKWRFFWKARILREYDIVIFSWDCLGAMRHVRPDAEKVYYCHTPPRYLYDFREKYLMSLPTIFRPIFSFAFRIFASIYESHLAAFDQIFTNSKNVQSRLKHFTGYHSTIVYPPTDTDFFVPWSSDTNRIPYFLSWARLSPPKRVDLIVDTFLMLPEKHLIITYGKNDPEKSVLLEKIQGAKNIRAIESPDDQTLLSLIQWATATIYIPVDEDFGMSPVESMACGIPVIGSAEWWLLETIVEGKTGKLIDIPDRESGMTHLREVIENTLEEEWRDMWADCQTQAMNFSLDSFQKKLKSSLYT